MEKYEITGDWMSLSVEEFTELMESGQAINSGMINDVMTHPGIRKLNVEVKFPKVKDLCTIEILPDDKIGDADAMVVLRLFTLKGSIAIFRHFVAIAKKGQNMKLHGGFAPGLLQDRELVEMHTHQFFIVFCLVQYMMLHGTEKISFHKEYRNALKPPKASRLSAPYTLPGKVRILELKATADEVRECIRRGSAIHVWHCPA